MTEKRQNSSPKHSNKNTGIKTSLRKGTGKNTSEIAKLQSVVGNRAVSDMMKGNLSMPAATEIGLPQNVQSKMEQSFGTSFSDVKVHEDPKALSMGARAYTQGSNIFFAPGQFSPNTQNGQGLIGHELSHVVQQREGKVSRHAGDSALNLDRNLERSADREGERAATGREARGGRISATSAHVSSSAAQMKPIDNSSAPVQASLFGSIGNFAKKAWSGAKNLGKKALNFGMKSGQSFVANGGLQMLAGMYANKQAGGGAMQGFVNSGGLNVASGMLGAGGQEQQGGQAGGQAGGQQAGGGGDLSGIIGLLGNLLGGQGQQGNSAVMEEAGTGSDAHQQTKKRVED